MDLTPEEAAKPTIVGRSSSHFTRITRIFAAEMRVEHEFQIVKDLMSLDPTDYGGNPALRLPLLRTSHGVWFGALNISRQLCRQSTRKAHVVWPEHLEQAAVANAQELTTQAMATEVTLIMSTLATGQHESAHAAKLRSGLRNTISWLEHNVASVLSALPVSRDFSYLEVSLFCLVKHLQFRDILQTSDYPRLSAFCEQFGQRQSATLTEYRFDS